MTAFWHGGVPGLPVGALLTGGSSPRPGHEGCPTCTARAAEYAGTGPTALADPASARPGELYITTDREYARLYASLWGRGDLYRVEPLGPLTPSTEDEGVPCWTTPTARVAAVYARAVLLTPTQRRANLRRVEDRSTFAGRQWYTHQLTQIRSAR